MINQKISAQTAQSILDAFQAMLKAYGDKHTVMHTLRRTLSDKIKNKGKIKKAGDGNDANIIRSGVLFCLKPSRPKYKKERHLFDAYIAFLDSLVNGKKSAEKDRAAIAFEIVAVVGKRNQIVSDKPAALKSFAKAQDIVSYVLAQLQYTGTIMQVLDTLPVAKNSNATQGGMVAANADVANEKLQQELAEIREALADSKEQLSAAEALLSEDANAEKVTMLQEQVYSLEEKLANKDAALSEYKVACTISDKEACESGINFIKKIISAQRGHSIYTIFHKLPNFSSDDLIDQMVKEGHFLNIDSMRGSFTPFVKNRIFEAVMKSQRTILVLKDAEKDQYVNQDKVVLSAEEIERNCEIIEVIFQSKQIRFDQSRKFHGIGMKAHLSLRIDSLRWLCAHIGHVLCAMESQSHVDSHEQAILSQSSLSVTGSQHDIDSMMNAGEVVGEWKQGVLAKAPDVSKLFPEEGGAGIEIWLNKIRHDFSELQTEKDSLSARLELTEANLRDAKRSEADARSDNKKLALDGEDYLKRIAELEAELKNKESWVSPEMVAQRLQQFIFNPDNK